MEVNDRDGHVATLNPNRPNRGQISHRRTKMAVINEKNAFAGDLNTTSPAQGHRTARRTNMTAIKRNLVSLSVFVGIVGTPIGSAYAQACKTNIANEDPATMSIICPLIQGGHNSTW